MAGPARDTDPVTRPSGGLPALSDPVLFAFVAAVAAPVEARRFLTCALRSLPWQSYSQAEAAVLSEAVPVGLPMRGLEDLIPWRPADRLAAGWMGPSGASLLAEGVEPERPPSKAGNPAVEDSAPSPVSSLQRLTDPARRGRCLDRGSLNADSTVGEDEVARACRGNGGGRSIRCWVEPVCPSAAMCC